MHKHPLNQEPGNQEPSRPDHLGYLLTAYLFENLSPAGKSEVESHLVACDACRDQLAALRATLGLAEAAFNDDGKAYVFETRRRQRILEAATLARFGFFNRASSAIRFRSWKELAVVAAMLTVVVSVTLSMFISAGSKSSISWKDSEPHVLVTELRADGAASTELPGFTSEIAPLQPRADGLSRGTDVMELHEQDVQRKSRKPAAAANAPTAQPEILDFTTTDPAIKADPGQGIKTWAFTANSTTVTGTTALAGTTSTGNSVQDRILQDAQKPIAPTKPSTPPPVSAPAAAAEAIANGKSEVTKLMDIEDGGRVNVNAGDGLAATLDDVIGIGGQAAPGASAATGGGWGGGNGPGTGVGTGQGKGSWGESKDEASRRVMVKRYGGSRTEEPKKEPLLAPSEHGLFPASGGPGVAGGGEKKDNLQRGIDTLAAVVPEFDQNSGGFAYDPAKPDSPSPLEGEGLRERSERGVRGATSVNAPKLESTLNRGLNESKGDVAGLKLNFNEARDRELQVQSELSTVKNALPMQQAAQNGELPQGIVVQNKGNYETSGFSDDKAALAKLQEKFAESEKEKESLERDLSRQTQRIEALVAKGVPVLTIVQEDAAAAQPEILPDPATAAARTGLGAKNEAEKRLDQLSAGQSLVDRPAIAQKDERAKDMLQSVKEEVSQLGLEGLAPEPAMKALEGQELQPLQKEIVKKYKEIPGPAPVTTKTRDKLIISEDALEELQEEVTGQEKVAIAAKDDTIRRQEELLAKERTEKEELHAELLRYRDMKYSTLDESVANVERNPAKSNKRGRVAVGAVVVPADVLDKAELGDAPVELGRMGHGVGISKTPTRVDTPLGAKYGPNNLAVGTTELLAIRDSETTIEGALYHRGKIEEEFTSTKLGRVAAEKEALVNSFDGDLDEAVRFDPKGKRETAAGSGQKVSNDSLYLEYPKDGKAVAANPVAGTRIPGDTTAPTYYGFVTPNTDGKVVSPGIAGEDNSLNYFDSNGTQLPAAGLQNAPAGFRRQWYSKAFGSPTLGQGQSQQLIRLTPLASPLGANITQLKTDERTLRAYNHLRAESSNAKALSFAEFCKRPAPIAPPVLTDNGLDEDAYIEKHGTRPFVDAKRDHLSTFSMDVDTASYTRARSQLRENNLPDPAAVRVEEFVNYFKQPYTVAGEEAFGVFAEAAPSPFSSVPAVATKSASSLAVDTPALQLLKIGIKSRDPKPGERKPAMLTFAVDTSGSMTRDDRLDMLRAALGALVEQLQPEDAVSIVAFADQAQVLLPRTQARQKQRILDAVAALHPDGGTNVEAGLALAYRIADESFSPDAVNRVILCSDGVANVGAKGPEAVLKTVKVFAGRGIDLSSVGFGMGKYNDEMMMKLADNGNGSCHFVDTLDEARRIFTQQLPPHLSALARDAKIQVEFNPTVVARYRLLGYEKRKIADKDFRNDAIDAGEVQHSTLVTALYEIERAPAARGPLGKVFLRWKDAGHRHLPVIERNFPLDESMQAASAESASPQLRFLACVARFAELLRNSPWTRNSSFADVLEQLDRLPADFKQRDDCKEVRELVQRAQTLSIREWSKNL